MGKMIKIFIISVLIVGINCVHSQTIQKKARTSYSGNYTGIDTLLNIRGYFLLTIKFYQKSTDTYSTNERCLIFYKDGMFLYADCFYPKGDNNTQNDLKRYIPPQDRWGNYVIENDTIKAQTFEPPMSSTRFRVGEIWFKIIDKNNIQHINQKSNSNLYSIEYIPVDDLPNPDESWLKRKKWFWCDKEAFKQWKKNQKK